MVAILHKCEQCDDARFHGREWCELHTKKPAPSQQGSSAMTATKICSIEGCDRYGREHGPYCLRHERIYSEEWWFCQPCLTRDGLWRWGTLPHGFCAKHGGADYIPRKACGDELPVSDPADHPNPAPPEAKPCDDGNQQIVAKCLNCKGVGFLNLFTGEPVAFGEAMPEPDEQRCKSCLTPEEITQRRAADLADYRARLASGEGRVVRCQRRAENGHGEQCGGKPHPGAIWCLACINASAEATYQADAKRRETGVCWCYDCNPELQGKRMFLCPCCGNKRCGMAESHLNACAGSNEVQK